MIFFLIPILLGASMFTCHDNDPDCSDWTSCEVDSVPDNNASKFRIKILSVSAGYTKGN